MKRDSQAVKAAIILLSVCVTPSYVVLSFNCPKPRLVALRTVKRGITGEEKLIKFVIWMNSFSMHSSASAALNDSGVQPR